MTNKKIWLSLLAIALIVCMISVGLVSCKGKEKTEENKAPAAAAAILDGIVESVKDGDMTDLTVDAELGLKINETQYTLKLALDLDLLQYTMNEAETDRDLNEQKDYSNTELTAQLLKGNDVLLGLYYADAHDEDEAAEITDAYAGNSVYVQYKDQKMYFDAPYVAAVQNAKDGQVNFSGVDFADLENTEAWDTVDMIVSILGGVGKNGKVSATEASLEVKLGDVLNDPQVSKLLGQAQSYFDMLGLDLDGSELGKVLPNITLKIAAKLDNGKATKITLGLGIDEKNIDIKTTAGGSLIKVNMEKDLNVELSLKYEVGGTPNFFWPQDIDSYTYQENIIDIGLSVDLELSAALGASLDLNGNQITIAAQPGQYTFKIALAANPWKVISKINTDELSFDGIDNILSSIQTILDAVNSAEISLFRNKDGDGHDIARLDAKAQGTTYYTYDGEKFAEDTKPFDVKKTYYTSEDASDLTDKTKFDKVSEGATLYVLVANKYYKDGNTYKTEVISGKTTKLASLYTNILDGIGLGIDGLPIGDVINMIKPIITGGASTADIDATLAVVGNYLKAVTIGINDGTHDGLYAAFDTSKTDKKVIPFSGYTEFKGAFNSKYTYYTKGEGENYTKATGITEFAPDTTYYVLGANEQGGDFGIGLNASLQLNEAGLTIQATVENLDVFGLPKSLTAKISNIQFSAFEADYSTFVVKDSKLYIMTLSEVKALN